MVLCSGAFDGLHAGHVRYLKAAQGFAYAYDARTDRAEPVWVAVAPDSYIRAHKQREPYWSQEDRVNVVAWVKDVWSAVSQDADTPAQLIRETKPRLFVKGIDWAGKLPQDVVDACREVGCTIVYVDTPGRHVSEARG